MVPAIGGGIAGKVSDRLVIDLWTQSVKQNASGVAFRFHDGLVWHELTWQQADAMARQMAAGLLCLGLNPGDRVCLLSNTRYEWVLLDVAVLLAGGVTVPIYPSSTAEQCAFIINNCGARFILCEDPIQFGKVQNFAEAGVSIVYTQEVAHLEDPDAQGRTGG